MRRLVALLVMLTLTACATVQHGPVQRIPVDSEPQGAVVRTSHCGPGSTRQVRTPGIVWVSRRAERCTLTITAPGHYAEQITLHRRMAEEFLDNATAIGGLCCDGDWLGWLFVGTVVAGTGFVLDTATGALFEQEPKEVFVRLEPVQER